MKLSSVIKYVLSILAAAVLLYVSFRGVDWKEFWTGIQSCRWEAVALAMAASIAAFFFRSQRWRCLLQPFDPDMDSLTTFNGVNIGYLANFLFPRIGEFVRCGFVSRRSRARHADDPGKAVSYDRTLGTVLLSRTWDVMVVFLLIAVLLVARWQRFGDFFADRMWEPLHQKLSMNVWWLVAGIAAIALLLFLLIRHNGKGRTSGGKVAEFGRGIITGFKSFTQMPHKGAFLVYTVLIWAMYSLMSMSILWAMPQTVSMGWVDAWFICLAGSVAWMVPVPGGFGAYHGIVALALTSIYGLSWETGVLCATLNHESQAITMMVCGIISYISELTRK